MQKAVDDRPVCRQLDDAKQFNDMMVIYSNPAAPQAAARVQQVLQATATYAPALVDLGLIQQQQGQSKEAEHSYEKVLADYPLFAPAFRQLSILYARDGDKDAKASEYGTKAGQMFPDDSELAKVVGLVEATGRKNYAKSLSSLKQSAQKKAG